MLPLRTRQPSQAGVRKQVYENRIEYNEPSSCLWKTGDNVTTVYFDRKITHNAAHATMCSPACTHWSFCPDWCGICGEALVVYGGSFCCGACRKHLIIYGWEDAEAIADAIMKQQKICVGKHNNTHSGSVAPELGQTMQK